jgi:tetratricopeptide (TPR) repeat protein
MRPNQKIQMSKGDVLFHKAFAQHQAGNITAAEELYRKALAKAPNDMETLYLLGTACSQQGKPQEAATYLKKALALDPRHPQALNNMGLTLVALRREVEAVDHYERALTLLPDYAEARNNLGNALQMLGRLDEAEPHLRRALELSPRYPEALYNLGLVLKGKDRFEEAAQCFLQGIALDAGRAAAYDDLGQIYGIWGRFETALAYLDRAIALSPDVSATHNNRGTMLEELGRYDEALAEYERAFALNPNQATPLWNQAFLFLRQGILDRGWEKHELRFQDGHTLKRFPYPAWDGSSLEGKTILIYAEQGLGDEILFASCFPEMIVMAKHCVIECEPRLAPLFSRSFPSATVVGSNRTDIGWLLNVPAIDVQVAAGSIPRFLRPTLASFPATPAYLVPEAQRVEYWRSRLATLGPGMKVGICWRSGLTKGARKKLYSELTQWGEIFAIPGIHFVNLQYGECTEELQEASSRFGITITAFPDIDLKNDIDDSAALMAGVDLMICASTAVSEIGGAIGIDQFLISTHGRQWDHLGCTDRMPWHPRIRIFQQPSLGDWDTQLASVANVLREHVEGKAAAIEYVRLSSGEELAVQGALEDPATYVLKEQQGWFEPEHALALRMVRPDMRIVDLGAGCGVFSIPLARRLFDGRLWSMTLTAADTDLLMKSRSRNGLDKILSVGIAEPNLQLDVLMDRYGLDDIAFVRLAADVANVHTLSGATRFFEHNSPLVMFGVRGRDIDGSVVQWFADRGYRLYRNVPGLTALVSLTSISELDSFTSNLFACREERAAVLERDGVLARASQALDSLPGIDLCDWHDYFAPMPYSGNIVDLWERTSDREPNWEVYWMALNLYARAKSQHGSASERYVCLQTAFNVMGELLKQNANLPRLITYCRILTDLGMREAAVGMLNKVCELLNSGMSRTISEPFLALADTFAERSPGDRIGDWVVAMLLEQRENLRAFSTFFTGQESLAALREVRSMGAAGIDTVRRIALIEARFGID